MSSPAVVTQNTSVDTANSVNDESNNKKPMRALAAPSFESEDGGDVFDAQPRSIDKSQAGSANISGEGRVDHTNFAFPALEPYDKLTLAKYCGPTPESNWVIPGLLLVGAYPASLSDEETFDLISGILKCGIRKFVCLQLEYVPAVSEPAWRSGAALRPYFEDVRRIVREKNRFPDLVNHPNVVNEESLSFVHCPIVDCGVTDDSKVLRLAEELVADISRGQVIYIHCWGGHGRTGTVVSIMLHLMYGLSAIEAMRRCQAVHDLRRCPVNVGSPQTQPQRDQVVRILNCLSGVVDGTSSTTKRIIGRHSVSIDFTSKPPTSQLEEIRQAQETTGKERVKRGGLSRLSFNSLYDSLRGGGGVKSSKPEDMSTQAQGHFPRFWGSSSENPSPANKTNKAGSFFPSFAGSSNDNNKKSSPNGSVGSKPLVVGNIVVERMPLKDEQAVTLEPSQVATTPGNIKVHAPSLPVSSSSSHHPHRRGSHIRTSISSQPISSDIAPEREESLDPQVTAAVKFFQAANPPIAVNTRIELEGESPEDNNVLVGLNSEETVHVHQALQELVNSETSSQENPSRQPLQSSTQLALLEARRVVSEQMSSGTAEVVRESTDHTSLTVVRAAPPTSLSGKIQSLHKPKH
eukprot:gene3487-3820_t